MTHPIFHGFYSAYDTTLSCFFQKKNVSLYLLLFFQFLKSRKCHHLNHIPHLLLPIPLPLPSFSLFPLPSPSLLPLPPLSFRTGTSRVYTLLHYIGMGLLLLMHFTHNFKRNGIVMSHDLKATTL